MFETTAEQKRFAAFGRKMMDLAVTEKDDVRSSNLARVGNLLTMIGTVGGPKIDTFSGEDLALITAVARHEIK